MNAQMNKKPYIVSIHSHRGSMWEASGTHEIVSLTDQEYEALCAKYQYEEIASELVVCVTPITRILDNSQLIQWLEKKTDISYEEIED